MPKMEVKANGETFECDGTGEERLELTGPTTEAQCDQYGLFSARPEAASLIASRRIIVGDRPSKGDPVFLRMAVESQLWNNRDNQRDKWPSAKISFDVTQGKNRRETQKVELERLLVHAWSLHWQGEGQDGLKGAAFTESVTMTAYGVKRTSVAGNNKSVNANFGFA
jgi:hypothetical protein